VADLLIRAVESFHGAVVLFAISREAEPFVGLFSKKQKMGPGRWLCGDPPILVDQLGVGRSAAQQRLEALLASGCRPERIVIAGFAGALREGYVLGDVLVASEVVDESGGRWQTSWPAKRWGRVLTCDKMIGEPEQKRQLGHEHQADVVDMESSAIADVCQRQEIPFGCIRVISDDVYERLSPRLITLIESGRVSPWRLFKEIISSPGIVGELMRLAKQTRLAADRLAASLMKLIGTADHDVKSPP